MSSEKDLRKRLEALNRRPLPESPKTDAEVEKVRHKLRKQREQADRAPADAKPQPPDAILYRRDLPQAAPRPARLAPGPPVNLNAAVSGVEVSAPRGGRAFLIANDVVQIDEKAVSLCKAFQAAFRRQDSSARRWIAANCGLADVRPRDVLFLDIETTGLGSTPLFLIGTMEWDNDGLIVRQYFARTYAEEAAVISFFLEALARKSLLVSFNGKSFDLPYVQVRAAANVIPFDMTAAHFDLLHVSRRIWRGRLPDCKLQTLERLVCGRTRHGDIPGSEIPQAYHDYVRTGDARDMVECLKHNMLDLVTLADLMLRLPPPE